MDSKLSRWCDGLIEAGWLAAVIATPLFFNIHSDRVFEPDKLTLLRSIALIMAAAWLVKFIDLQGWHRLGAARWGAEGSIWRMPFALSVSALAVAYLISTLFSVTPSVSWAGSYQRLQGTYTTLSYLVVFGLTMATMRSRAQVSRVVTAIIITSIPVAFYGLLQHFDLDPLPWGGDVTARVAGHMGNAIFIAAYLIMAVPLTLGRITDAFTSILADDQLVYADVIRSSIYIFILAIQLITIYWTQSRGPWMGLFVGLFAFVLIVMVSLRITAADRSRFRPGDALKAVSTVLLGSGGLFLVFDALFMAIGRSGRIPSLQGAVTSFAAFAAAVGVLVIFFFVFIAARRGWRWIWLSWLILAFLLAGWLAAFNFAEPLQVRFDGTPVLGGVSATLSEWRSLPAIGRLGRLLESESGTGKVRALIWEGALDLLAVHDPLRFPGGEEDDFNLLRPLFGYGPESMYVAYNRFYPPELATVEARNASPDRSHNETLDALVITGVVGFLVWQALYLSVFYYSFSWLGVVRSRRDRILLIGFWIGGAVLAAVFLTQALGQEFIGVSIPVGSISGLVLYLVYYALFADPGASGEQAGDPFQRDRLLMIGLVTAILAHYVEIHFGIAIAATRVHFFVYTGLLFMVGYWLPRKREAIEPVEAPKGRKRRKARPRGRSGLDEKWGPVLLSAVMLALTIGIMGYEFTTYSLPPDKVINAPTDLTAGEIFHQSFFINASDGFRDSPFIFVMIMLTWILGTLIIASELVIGGELKGETIAPKLPDQRRLEGAALFFVMLIASAAARFIIPAPAAPSTSLLLGRSLMLVWAALCLWTGIMLAFNNAAAGNLAGGVALAGLLFSLPLLIAGSGFIALVLAALCSLLLYRLWDRSWQGLLLPAAAIALVSLSLGLAYAYLQASLLRSSLFLNPTAQVASAVELRLLEAEQSSAFLSAFYAFVIFTLLLGAFLASRHWMNKVSNRSSPAAYASLAVLAILLLMAINRSNMRIIQADVLYKRAKPFDANASSTRSPEDWEVAIAIYERAVDMVPLEDFYYLFLGRAFLEQSTVTTDPVAQDTLLERAQERLLEAQRINPLNTDHTANLARLNTRWVQLSSDESETQRRLEAAENYYQAALSLSPQNSIIRNEYARLTYDLKRDCDRAIEIYNESADIDPYYDVTYFGRAEILMACGVGKPEEVRRQYTLDAVGSLEEGLAINDGNVRVWLQLGQAYHELAVYEASLAAYEEARVRNNNEFPLWNFDYWMASVHIDMGDRETAENLVSQALQNAPLEAHAQIQALLGPQQISITESVPVPPLTSVPRPLSGLTPFERNNFYSEPPPMIIDLAKSYEAVMVTEKGEMRFRLLDDEAPLTVNNFAFLAGQGFYDGVSFFRVLEGFMAQGGDPTDGGTGGPGYRFADEFNPGRSFDRRGLLAMANAGPDTNGSQFFITFAPALHLNGRHTIFGELIAGDDVLGAISLRDPDNPAGPGDVLERVEIIEVGQ